MKTLAIIDAAAKAASLVNSTCHTDKTIAAIREQANSASPHDATVTINARGALSLAWQFERYQAKLLEERRHSRRLATLLEETEAKLEKANLAITAI
jgi:hypothetical protein